MLEEPLVFYPYRFISKLHKSGLIRLNLPSLSALLFARQKVKTGDRTSPHSGDIEMYEECYFRRKIQQ